MAFYFYGHIFNGDVELPEGTWVYIKIGYPPGNPMVYSCAIQHCHLGGCQFMGGPRTLRELLELFDTSHYGPIMPIHYSTINYNYAISELPSLYILKIFLHQYQCTFREPKLQVPTMN